MKKGDIKNLAHALLEMTDGESEAVREKAVKEFAAYLQKNRLLSKAEKIMKEYRTLYNEKHSILEASVTLTARLPEHTRIELREALKKKFKAKEVHMLEKVDQRVLGGIKVKIADMVYDSTLKNTLTQLEAQLLK
ncbi:MAG: ATP synthase F1 subunit delta [Candidatus Pacebacteria bacterium]|nr:ATP synthase F1 subunit delta [Candidatus Paceibacterota bacterium]